MDEKTQTVTLSKAVLIDGVIHPKGHKVELSADEAKRFGDLGYVEGVEKKTDINATPEEIADAAAAKKHAAAEAESAKKKAAADAVAADAKKNADDEANAAKAEAEAEADAAKKKADDDAAAAKKPKPIEL